MTDPAQVSVLLPVYRPDPEYFRAALDSVVAQTFGDWDMVVIEEPPASGAKEIVEAVGDPRIRHHLRGQRTHLCDSLNEGLSLCRGGLIARMDADDLMEPDRLTRQHGYLSAHPDVAVVGSAITVIDETGGVIGRRVMPTGPEAVSAAMRRYNAVTHPSAMFRREAVDRVGGYRPVRAEDYDLWCRLIKGGYRIANLPDELLRYRYHLKSVKTTTVHEMIRESIATKLRHFEHELGPRDRLRLATERALLLLPPRVVLRLFRLMVY